MAGMHRDKCGAAAVAGFFQVNDTRWLLSHDLKKKCIKCKEVNIIYNSPPRRPLFNLPTVDGTYYPRFMFLILRVRHFNVDTFLHLF